MKPTDDRVQSSNGEQSIVHRRVMLINIVPFVYVPNKNLPISLWKYLNWKNPELLVKEYINAISVASKGLITYHVMRERTVINLYPLQDGYQYTVEELLEVIQGKKPAHSPSLIDYKAILTNEILQGVQRNEVDEVWVMGYPHAGLWESAMGGPDPYFINGGPIAQTESAGRRFVVMGFNYERGVGEMLESFGHRVERTLARAFDSDAYLNWFYKSVNYGVVPSPAGNEWEQFLIDQGTVHREAGAPAGQDYYWHKDIEEHHRRWLGGLQAEWWKRVVNVNEYE